MYDISEKRKKGNASLLVLTVNQNPTKHAAGCMES
jgi:hypothetical protein